MQATELTVGDVIILWGSRIRLTCYVGLISCLAYWWGETLDTREIEPTMVALKLYQNYEVTDGTPKQAKQTGDTTAEVRPSV